MTSPRRAPVVGAARLPGEARAANLATSPRSSAIERRRTRPFPPRRALLDRLTDRDRPPDVHPPDPGRASDLGGEDRRRPQPPGRHARPRPPDRGAGRGGLHADDRRGRRGPERRGIPISGIGGVAAWRDAARLIAPGCGAVQACTAATTCGFRAAPEMATGLGRWMPEAGHPSTSAFQRRAVPNATDWRRLNLTYATKARIGQEACIKRGRCYAACEDTSHQAISMSPERVFEVKDDECVACNLCVDVCPVETCITMERLAPGAVDPRTGKLVEERFDDWTTHPNTPARVAAE